MTGCMRNQCYGFDIDEYGKKTFYTRESEKVLFTLFPLYEFALQIESEEYKGIITSNMCEKKSTEDRCFEKYYHPLFDMQVSYSMDEDAVYKNLSLVAKKDFTIRYAQTEVSKTFAPLTRGGEGQPIFVADSAFVSIIFPAAQNYIDGDILRLEQAPYISLIEGETFDFFTIVYGFPTRKTVEESFLQYIVKHKKKTPAGLKIYSDWGAHDELANEEYLDEKMALRLLGNLQKAKEEGVSFDYYLMDAKWFEDDRLYQSFKKWAWPQGPEKFLTELKNMGMKFGLWFDVNIGMLELPEQVIRNSENSESTCFSYKENADLLFDGIRTQIKESDCTMLKLDFAFFDCQEPTHSVHAVEKLRSKEPAIRNFLNGLTSLYKETSNLIVLGYNGFTTNLDWILSVDPNRTGYMISPWWCLYMDYLCCGDTRPSELPSQCMGDSLVYYSDSMINKFREALMPYSAIDDHATMVGNTNTIFYLGKEHYRDSWIMNICRGSKKMHLYGELELFDHEDWLFVKESQKMFDFVSQEEVYTEAIFGEAQKGQLYGYNNSNGNYGYITLVNPQNTVKEALLDLQEWQHEEGIRIRKYYGDKTFGSDQYEQIINKKLVKLAPHEICIYQWEKIEEKRTSKEGYIILDANGRETILFSKECKGFSLQLMDEKASPLRIYGVEEPIQVECFSSKNKIERMYKQPIWSGCSWAVYRRCEETEIEDNLTIRLHNCSGKCLYIKWCEL